MDVKNLLADELMALNKPTEKTKILLKPLDEENVQFQASVRLPIKIARCFGFFPIHGISGPDYESLKFFWNSFRTYYSLVTLGIVCFTIGVCIERIYNTGYNLDELRGLVFNICGAISCTLFIILAKHWPELMKEWHEVEMHLRSYGIRTNLKRRIKVLTVLLLSVAAMEHLLVKIYRLMKGINCTRTVRAALINYAFSVGDDHVFSLWDFTLWKNVLIMIANLQMTFSWTFVDVFIMIVSTGLLARMSQITNKITILLKSKVKTPIVWRNLREEHGNLCRLCSIVDDKISYIVLLSYSTNLFFILAQLFNSLRRKKNLLEKFSFLHSFGFLIMRIVCVCMFGASIYDEGKNIVPLLLSVPSTMYNFEIGRFIEQAINIKVALTGKNFFTLTRGLILKIAGAIVTYELVLIQFNENLLHDDNNKELTNEEKIVVMKNSTKFWLC